MAAVLRCEQGGSDLGKDDALLPPPPPQSRSKEPKTFFGFFKLFPLVDASCKSDTVVIVNAFRERTTTRLEGIRKGKWVATIFDSCWDLAGTTCLTTDANGGIDLDINGKEACHTVILIKMND